MDVSILSGDPLFVAAAEGIAGAMGHFVVREGSPASGGVTICDVATVGSSVLLERADPMRVVLFVGPGGLTGQPELGGFVHFYARTKLAVELPKALALLAGSSTVW